MYMRKHGILEELGYSAFTVTIPEDYSIDNLAEQFTKNFPVDNSLLCDARQPSVWTAQKERFVYSTGGKKRHYAILDNMFFDGLSFEEQYHLGQEMIKKYPVVWTPEAALLILNTELIKQGRSLFGKDKSIRLVHHGVFLVQGGIGKKKERLYTQVYAHITFSSKGLELGINRGNAMPGFATSLAVPLD